MIWAFFNALIMLAQLGLVARAFYLLFSGNPVAFVLFLGAAALFGTAKYKADDG